MSKTWWGEKFIEALTSFIDESRLSRGRAYRSPFRLSQYSQKGNSAKATVRGNINPYFGVYETPYYKTEITFKTLKNWAEMLEEITEDPLILAKLITRELPTSIAKILPQTSKDMTTRCSCPDWQNPCKHVAGLYFKLAEEIDHNPLLIFELRGISADVLTNRIKSLVQPTQKTHPQLKAKKLPKQKLKDEIGTIKNFWGTPKKIKQPNFDVIIPCILVKKAGINPPFWAKRKAFIEVADTLYKSIRREWKKPVNTS